MRSTLLCVFFTLIIRREDVWAQSDDFRPTPIPLNEWHHDRRDNHADTLHETFRTAAPPAVAAVPAHYWEDALRHSVYLTLVRDKIDQLIAKGDVISPNSKPNGYDSKEIDDHDLWDKIKSAPFDRLPEDEPASFGDVTIMAKGRLLERNGGFRFAEDERTKEKCSNNNCLQDVKAFWSVKRVRQRDQEMSPGKYHYELTFSVISQTPQKQRKPYENPIRTFTVRESSPAKIFENPKEYNRFSQVQAQVSRPERAVWVHKNIGPSKFIGRKQYVSGIEKIFSSLFSDDDDDRSYEAPVTKNKHNSYFPPGSSQYSKIGHVGIPVDVHSQIPYPYRPQPVKHVRPPLHAPPTNTNQYQHQEIQGPPTTAPTYAQYPYDHRLESSQIGKTTRPAVLPTPLPPISSSIEQSAETINMMSMDNINHSVKPDSNKFHKTYNKYNTPVKVNYFSDPVRPPIYNAPPGVFVTMDKKPFKPMPPLKLVNSKFHKTNKPIDFRPSPQIVDQTSEQDLFSETDFRPMTINFSDNISSEKGEVTRTTSKKPENKTRKPSSTAKKPPKKHDNVNNLRYTATTAVPDIITAQTNVEEEIENMAWANILGSFTKTTPMDVKTEKTLVIDATTLMTPSNTVTPESSQSKMSTTTEKEREITTSTTMKPKRRTRPPPKFTKPEKVKKHKRLTTTTTTSTTISPESTVKRKPTIDLTSQASSSPTVPLKQRSTSTTISTTTTTTSTTTTTPKPTTTKTTTTQMPTTTTSKPSTSTTQIKNKNRFRQSTLILKGTSVKHDRWSTAGMQKNQTATTPMAPSSSLHRRKGSNFQGYVSSTTARYIDEEKEREREKHVDHKIKSHTTEITTKTSDIASQTNMYEEAADQYEANNVMPLEIEKEGNNYHKNAEEESKDKAEYIFESTVSPITINKKSEDQTTPKNKSKCKKKKQSISTTVISSSVDSQTTTASALATTLSMVKNSKDVTTTETDILEDFINYSFNENNKATKNELLQEESSNHANYMKFEDDLNDFLGVLKNKNDKEESLIDDEYSDENDNNRDDEDNNNKDHESDEDDSESDDDDYEESKIPSIDDDIDFNSEEDKDTPDDSQYKDESDPKARQYSFLELMAMS